MSPAQAAGIRVLVNASFYGNDDADTIVWDRDRITAIGRADDLVPQLEPSHDVPVIDLEGRFVLPGFIDAHIHLLHTGLVESGWRVDLMGQSRSQALETLSQAAKERAEEWVIAYGWDESHWTDRGYLTKDELDRIAPQSPLLAIRMDGHLLAANSLAMKQIPHAAPEHLIDRMNGLLREQAVTVMTGAVRPDRDASIAALDAAARLCHRLGITTVHTMTRLDDFEAFLTGRHERKLRITFCPDIQSFDKLLAVGLKTGYGDPWLRFGGVKIFADGSIGAGNAAVSSAYLQGGLGELNHEDDELRTWIETADRAGWQTIIHAIGDRAIDQVLGAHEHLHTDPSLRHRMEHFELPVEDQLPRVKQAGLHLCMQPNFITNWSGPNSLYVDRLGSDRDQMSNPLRLIHDLDLPLAFGSDGMPPSPLIGLHGAIHGAYPQQRLTVSEAIDCYTMGSARFAFEEDEKGSLEVGKLADLVVLDSNPMLDIENIAKRSVDMTFVGGELVYSRKDVL